MSLVIAISQIMVSSLCSPSQDINCEFQASWFMEVVSAGMSHNTEGMFDMGSPVHSGSILFCKLHEKFGLGSKNLLALVIFNITME